MDDIIGPSLPFKRKPTDENSEISIGPVLPSKKEAGSVSPDEDAVDTNKDIGPSLPPHLMPPVAGPQMPPHLRKKDPNPPRDLEEGMGPKLPPHLQRDEEEESGEEEFGPTLPPGFSSKPKVVGPQIPPGLLTQSSDESEEDEIIGPLPPSADAKKQSREALAREFEKRSKKMKDRLEGREPAEKLEREEWMTELPPVLQGTLGVGPRQFRARALDIGDRSGWTDSPADKARKSKEKGSGEKKKETTDYYVAERDARIAEQLKDFKGPSDGQESLLSMHEKKRKRKLKEDVEAGVADERRPFDRELDLQVNQFDDAAKKRMLKQSAALSSRFAHGHTSGTFL